MIATTNAIAKIAAVAAGLGLVAMSFASFAPAAKAATVDEQIAALLAQIESLKGGASASTTFTMDLTLGSTGAEVTALQNWLISKGYSIPAGATGYFGAQTQSALASYQAAVGISPAAGYFGPITRAKVNAAGGSTGSTGGSTGGNTGGLSGGEASLGTVDGSSGDDDEVEEGASAQVAEFEFDVDDADVRLSRVDLEFETTNNGTTEEDEPWDTFDTITLLTEDGDEIASEDVSDEDEWLESDTSPYSFRFTGLDEVFEADETAVIVVEVETQSSVDGADETNSWTIDVANDGIRAIDGEGLDQYTGESNDGVTFDVVEEGQGEALNVNTSSEDPDSTTLKVKDDASSEWYTVFVFELESEESDIEIDSIPVDFTVSSGELVSSVINDAKLVIDGEEFDNFDFTTAGDAFGSTTFDLDGDLTIGADEEVTVEVMVKFAAANGSNYDEGDTIQASVVGANIDAEGTDDITPDGNATGETHTLAVDGLVAELVETDVDVDTDSTPDEGTFRITVALTAFGDDIYVATTTTEDSSLSSVGASTGWNYDLTGTTTTQADTSVDSTADSTTPVAGISYFLIEEGETEEFTLSVVGRSGTSIFSSLKLGAIQYGTTTSTAYSQTLYVEENDYKTDSVNLSN